MPFDRNCQFALWTALLLCINHPLHSYSDEVSTRKPTLRELLTQRDEISKRFQQAQKKGDTAAQQKALEDFTDSTRQLLMYKELGEENLNQLRRGLAEMLENLAGWYEYKQDFPAAERVLKERIEVQAARYGEKSYRVVDAKLAFDTLRTRSNLSADDRQRLEKAVSEHRKSGTFFGQKRYEDAIKSAQVAASIRQELLGKKHPDYATTLNRLGFQFAAIGEDDKAVTYYHQALEIRRESLGKNHPRVAVVLNNLGTFYESRGEYRQAKELYEQSLEIRRHALGSEDSDTVLMQNKLARIYQFLGEYGKAEPLFHEALKTIKTRHGVDDPRYATTLNNLAILYEKMGEYGQALRLLTEARDLIKRRGGENDPAYASSLLNLGSLYESMAEYDEAERLLREAVRISKRSLGEKHPDYATSLNALASLYQSLEKYALAESLSREVSEIYRNALGETHPDYAMSLNNLGALYESMGEYEKAGPLFQKASEIYRKAHGEIHPNYATALNNLAATLEAVGKYTDAEPLYNKALNINKQLFGEDDPACGNVLDNLAMLYHATERYEVAIKHQRQALEIFKKVPGKSHPRYAVCLNNLSMIYTSIGDYKQAEPLIAEAAEINKQFFGDEHPEYPNSLSNRAILNLLMGNLDRAEALQKEALTRKLDFIQKTIRAHSEATARRFLEASPLRVSILASIQRQRSEPRPVEIYSFLWRTHFLLGETLTERRGAVRESPEAATLNQDLLGVSQQLTQLTLTQIDADNKAERQRRLKELNDRKERLEQQLAVISAEFRKSLAVERATPGDLMKELPADAALVHFASYSDWQLNQRGANSFEKMTVYDAFVIQRSENEAGYTVTWIPLGRAEPIDAAVGRWLERIEQGGGDANATDDPARLLHARIWEKLESSLNGTTRVIIIPDSKLHFLPWAALPGRKDETYLIEDYVISVALSGQEIYRNLIENPERASPNGLLVVGGVDYDETGLSSNNNVRSIGKQSTRLPEGNSLAPPSEGKPLSWPKLAGTKIEADALAAMWSDGRTLLSLSGKQATESALKSSLPNFQYIHLATHGFFADAKFRSILQHDPQSERLFGNSGSSAFGSTRGTVTGRNPLILSGVIFAGANKPPKKDSLGLPVGDDGILTAQEVAGLDLANAELITLSACDTGKGTEVAAGEGIYGLRRAFHLAGSKTVVASLWKVDDAATQALMVEFYKNLWQNKMGKLEALRAAQLKMIQGYDPKSGEVRGLGSKPVPIVATGEKPKRLPPVYWAAFQLSGDWH